jgi:hypothetical protein
MAIAGKIYIIEFVNKVKILILTDRPRWGKKCNI